MKKKLYVRGKLREISVSLDELEPLDGRGSLYAEDAPQSRVRVHARLEVYLPVLGLGHVHLELIH